MNLASWLLEQIAADEAGARDAARRQSGDWRAQVEIEWDDEGDRWTVRADGARFALASIPWERDDNGRVVAEHIARQDPAHVLARRHGARMRDHPACR